MKNKIHYFLILLVASLAFSSCIEEDLVTYSESNIERNDPLKQILVNTPVLSFVAGEPSYTFNFLVITPGSDDAKNVEVYSTYTDATTGATSNEVLLGTYAVDAGQNKTEISGTITYEDLKQGITVNGGPLPDDQVDIPVGSKWDLRLSAVGSGGSQVFSGPGITVAVLSPFAGIYTVIESDYYRIGVQSGAADWSGTEIFIGSVDANTFSHNDWWGPFAASGNFVFDLNPDNTITIPDESSQLFFSGDDMLTCQEDGSTFVNVPCTGSNVLEPSPDGKHIIKLTYGYFTASGDENEGPREFYEVLEKKVD